MKLSELIIELTQAQARLIEAETENDEARQSYINNGGMSWGYAGQSYYNKIHQVKAKIDDIAKEIDEFNPNYKVQ